MLGNRREILIKYTFFSVIIKTRVGNKSLRVLFEVPHCMSLSQYMVKCFVIRYKNIGVLDLFYFQFGCRKVTDIGMVMK